MVTVSLLKASQLDNTGDLQQNSYLQAPHSKVPLPSWHLLLKGSP